MTFKELNIIQPILKAIEEKGYNRPTPIQQQAIPVALSRKDILGCAQTCLLYTSPSPRDTR